MYAIVQLRQCAHIFLVVNIFFSSFFTLCVLYHFILLLFSVFSIKSTSESNTKCSKTSSPMNVKKKERWWWYCHRCCCRRRRCRHHYHQSVHNNSLIRWYSLFDVCSFVRHSSHPHLFLFSRCVYFSRLRLSCSRFVCSRTYSQFSYLLFCLCVISLSFCSLFRHILFSSFMRYKTSTVYILHSISIVYLNRLTLVTCLEIFFLSIILSGTDSHTQKWTAHQTMEIEIAIKMKSYKIAGIEKRQWIGREKQKQKTNHFHKLWSFSRWILKFGWFHVNINTITWMSFFNLICIAVIHNHSAAVRAHKYQSICIHK